MGVVNTVTQRELRWWGMYSLKTCPLFSIFDTNILMQISHFVVDIFSCHFCCVIIGFFFLLNLISKYACFMQRRILWLFSLETDVVLNLQNEIQNEIFLSEHTNLMTMPTSWLYKWFVVNRFSDFKGNLYLVALLFRISSDLRWQIYL